MERTKSQPRVTYPIDQEPIVLSKPLLDLLLAQPKSADLIALYCFYYYTAKWQKTNQPKATTNYVAKGIKWHIGKVRRVKKDLKQLGLIEDIQARNEDNSKIIAHYIKVNFIWTRQTIKDYYPNGFAKGSKTQGIAKSIANALSDNNINALSYNRKNKKINKKSTASNETNNIPAHKTFINRFPQNWKDDTPFKKAARDFVLHRKQLGKSLTPLASKRLVTKLTDHSIKVATQAIQASVENSWTGVFPESVNNKTHSTKNRSGNHGGSDYYNDIDENEL